MEINLSFNKGLRIAKIVGDKKKESFLYVYDKEFKCCKDCSAKCDINKKVCCQSCAHITYHKKHLGHVADEDVENNSIVLPEKLKFELMPSNQPHTQPSCHFIFGSRGCGKSFMISTYLAAFKKLYPNYKIWLISRKEQDRLLDGLIDKRIDTTDLIDADLTAKDFMYKNGKGNLLIFDDVDTCSEDKKNNVKHAVYKLMDDVIEIGRSYSIFAIITAHIGCNGKESKRILNGATTITFFNSNINVNTTYMLNKHLGLSKKTIDRIRAGKTRSTTIIKSSPVAILQDKEAWLVDNKND
jgi:hypothetical protein